MHVLSVNINLSSSLWHHLRSSGRFQNSENAGFTFDRFIAKCIESLIIYLGSNSSPKPKVCGPSSSPSCNRWRWPRQRGSTMIVVHPGVSVQSDVKVRHTASPHHRHKSRRTLAACRWRGRYGRRCSGGPYCPVAGSLLQGSGQW